MRNLRLIAAIAGLASASAALPASAQIHYGQRYDHRTPSYADQFDRPGDYRCDAYWDRGRTDCHEGWRDQRPYGYRSTGYGHGYGQADRYGRYGHGYRGYGYGQGYAGQHGYARYGQSGYGYGGGSVHYGAYGRPDIVYGGGGGGYGHAGPRDPRRVEWCRWNYRSYNPATGYYLAYSGRYVFCG